MKSFKERMDAIEWNINYHEGKLAEYREEKEYLNQIIEFKNERTDDKTI